jgi:anaerobic ribonucleoside-triphosphate reductase
MDFLRNKALRKFSNTISFICSIGNPSIYLMKLQPKPRAMVSAVTSGSVFIHATEYYTARRMVTCLLVSVRCFRF